MKTKRTFTALLAALVLGQSVAFADGTRITVGPVAITGGALELIGTVSTLSLEDKHPAFTYIGWTLIVAGLLINGGDIAKADAAEVQASDVWNAMVREASVLARNPGLIKSDSAIANAATSLNIQAKDLAQLVLDLNAKAAIAKENKATVATGDLETKFFPNGFVSDAQRQAFKNLVALSSMS